MEKSSQIEISSIIGEHDILEELAEKILQIEFPDDYSRFLIAATPRGSLPSYRKYGFATLNDHGVVVLKYATDGCEYFVPACW